jgi:hypothetical protein
MKKSEELLLEEEITHIKSNNWLLMIIAIITIPFLVINM